MEKRYVIDVGPQLTYLMFRCHRKPAHCKNYVWPESRSKDVLKQQDHAFQTVGKPWFLSIEEDDEGVDVLDLLLQLLHQLRHRLAVALHVVSQAWL